MAAFLAPGMIIGQVGDMPAHTARALHEFAELGVVLRFLLIGLEIQLEPLRLGRDVLAFGAPHTLRLRTHTKQLPA